MGVSGGKGKIGEGSHDGGFGWKPGRKVGATWLHRPAFE